MLDNYQFKTTPYKHQLDVLSASKDAEYFALLMEQGTGKTKVLLDTAGYLWNKGRINSVVVVAPNGVHLNWAKNEIPIHLPDYVDRYIAVWNSSGTKAKEKELEGIFNVGPHLRFLCINVEALSTKRGEDFVRRVLKSTSSLLIVDESTTIKTPSARRTKALLKLRNQAKYRRIATGTPITKNPFDAYAQMNFLSDAVLGTSSFVAFKARYARMLDASSPLIAKIMRSGARFMPQIVATEADGRPAYQNLEELANKIRAHSFRVLKKDCLDLPDKIYVRRYYEMDPKQAQTYKQMKKAMAAEWKGKGITALNKLTMVMRLQQIVSGYVSPDGGEITPMFNVPEDNPKIQALLDLVEEISGPAIIFCRFIQEIKDLEKALSLVGPTRTYYGEITNEERHQAISDFQDGKVQFLIMNKTGSKGLTLTKASSVVFYTNEFDLEIRLQAEDRAHRIGQVNKVTYYDMECEGTVDSMVVSNLRGKKDVADIITGDPNIAWM